ncbi:hypothetical protein Tco_0647138 [Tanacetum coccineum]
MYQTTRNQSQNAFMEVLGAISENDAKDKTNDKTCLMAQSVQNEKRILELNEKIKKLERSKEIEIACKSCDELKLENAKLKETQVKFVKFDKSANSLREMLNNQKSPSCKIGLGFDSDKASTSETKTMSFIGSSSEKATDGSTIKGHGSTLPGSMSRKDSKKGTEHHDEFEDNKDGELYFFMGFKINNGRRIFFNQTKYIKEDGFKEVLIRKIPNQPRRRCQEIKLTKDDEADSVDSSKYQGMIGSLLYLTASRPDIMFSVCLCARFQENPKTTHLEAVKRIFRYIRGTSHLGLWYPKGTGIETVVYADSDHAGDYVDRKSTSGVCTFMGCCLTSWFAKKQTALAISTTEAESVSAGKASQQALWMKQALIDYGIRLDDIPIMCDNKGAIELRKNPVQHSGTKHIEIRHHFLRDHVQKGNISIEKVASKDNLAEIFTKPLKCEVFNYLRIGLGMMELIINFFGPKYDLVKKNITTPRTTKTQLLRDSNKLFLDDIRPDLRGWELFFRKFNFTLMIIYRIEEVINKRKGPMPFAMLLTRLYNHILTTNPQAIVPIARFTFHEHVMDPLYISINPSKEKGKKIASPSVISSSSSSSDDNEAPSFLEFYDELSDSKDLTNAQREKR